MIDRSDMTCVITPNTYLDEEMRLMMTDDLRRSEAAPDFAMVDERAMMEAALDVVVDAGDEFEELYDATPLVSSSCVICRIKCVRMYAT
jgi:hypothetical protein